MENGLTGFAVQQGYPVGFILMADLNLDAGTIG